MKILKILSISLLFISMHSCSKVENEPQMVIQKTIFEHVASSMNYSYSYLLHAMQKTDLDDILN